LLVFLKRRLDILLDTASFMLYEEDFAIAFRSERVRLLVRVDGRALDYLGVLGGSLF
jgi:hypothetical protein